MKDMVFISRHQPTEAQVNLAKRAGYNLIRVGDIDAFSVTASLTMQDVVGNAEGICVVNPALAMTALMLSRPHLGQGKVVAVFENGNRAPEGEKPQFEAVSLVIFEPVGCDTGEVTVYRKQFHAEGVLPH